MTNADTMIIRRRGIDRTNFPHKQTFIKMVEANLQLARELYPDHHIPNVPIVFYSAGNCSGRAKGRSHYGQMVYNLEFNVAAINLHWDVMTGNTIPHEVAHIISFIVHKNDADRGNGHGRGWKRIAKQLGCNGDTCHSMSIPPARQRSKHKYISNNNSYCELGPTQHKRLQTLQGYRVTIRTTGEEIYRHNYAGVV